MEDLTARFSLPVFWLQWAPEARLGFRDFPEWSTYGGTPALPGRPESQDSTFPKFLPLFSLQLPLPAPHCRPCLVAHLFSRGMPQPPPSPILDTREALLLRLCFGPPPSAPKQPVFH